MNNHRGGGPGSRRAATAAIPINHRSSSSTMVSGGGSGDVDAAVAASAMSYDERQAEQDYQDRSMAMFSRIVAHRQSQQRLKELKQQQLRDQALQRSPSSTATSLAVEGKYMVSEKYEQQQPTNYSVHPTAVYHYPTKADGHWASAATNNAAPQQQQHQQPLSFLIPPRQQQHHQQQLQYVYGSRPSMVTSYQQRGSGSTTLVNTALSLVSSLEHHQHQVYYHDQLDRHTSADVDEDADDGVFDLEL